MLEDYYDGFSAITTTATTFSYFQKLPAELRVKIWVDALPGPRTVHLVNTITSPSSPTTGDTSHGSDDFSYHSYVLPPCHMRPRHRHRRASNVVSHCTSTISCPKDIRSLLHTCRESRFEVLSRYQPLHAPRSLNDPYYRIHYFDPKIDGIFVDDIWPWTQGSSTKCVGLFKTRQLSISCNSWHYKWAMNSPALLGKRGLLRFKHLEELHIVFRVLADHEREKILQCKFGHYMGPVDLTEFLYRREAPNNIAFPDIGVDISVAPILERFEEMKKANPTWKVPKVKLIAWATRPPVSNYFSECEDTLGL